MNCPECKSSRVVHTREYRGNGQYEEVFECKDCGYIETT